MMSDSLRTLDLTQLNLDEATRQLIERLLNHIETLEAELQELREEVQRLRDEVARLKGQKGKPQFKANQSPDCKPDKRSALSTGEPKPTSAKVPRAERVKIDREVIVPLDRDQLPPDFESRGYREVTVQNIRFETDNVRYRLQRGYSASAGQFFEATLPPALQGQSFGPELQALVLMLHFELRVPQEKIWGVLNAQGIVISAGQISNIVIKKHLAQFAEERKAILAAGVESTSYQHIDDTVLRVGGVNHYLSTVGNPYFACFFIHRHKDWDTIADLFSLKRLDTAPAEAGESEPASESARALDLKALGEAILILIADGAPQFAGQTEYLALCWIHEERLYAKLRPYFETHQELLDSFRSQIWAYYDRLKAYAAAPSETEKQALSAAFDAFFARTTGYDDLDHRIALTRAKKSELLVVLDFPQVPLNNNLAERDLREGVVKRKISYGPRVPDGAQAWEVFLTLLATCRKNSVNFYAYLCDRISQTNQMPALDALVRARAPT